MIDRRAFLGLTTGAGAALALAPNLLLAQRSSKNALLERAIPSSGEKLPAISYGARAAEPAALKEILRTLLDNGGKVVDVLHGGPAGEQGARAAAREIGVEDKLFWTSPLFASIPMLPGHTGPPPTADIGAVRAAMEEKFTTLGVSKIDLVLVSAGADVPLQLSVLREMKKEGRVRYIGVHELLFPPDVKGPAPATARLETILRSESIDFIGVDYSVGDRRIEETVLPLAKERRVGVMAYFPFDRRRIFARANDTPLPKWASEFGAKNWAQFFLKYVLAHPDVTVVRTGTTKAEHMLDNLAAGRGRLPNEAMRKRMAEFVDALPPTPPPGPPSGPSSGPPPPSEAPAPAVTLSAETLDRYVGEYRYAAVGTIVTFRRDGDRLLIKSGAAPEAPLVARSETRFSAPWPDSGVEFELDGEGRVTRALFLLGPWRIPLERG